MSKIKVTKYKACENCKEIRAFLHDQCVYCGWEYIQKPKFKREENK